MPLFSPFPANPIVPSYYSLNTIDFNDITGAIQFVFPSSFPPYSPLQQAMASVVIFKNTGVGTPPVITLPDATLGAPGCGTVFMNTTSDTVVIRNFTNTVDIVSMPAQVSRVVYLNDNTTQNGDWSIIPLNQPSAPVTPSAIAGGGLFPLGERLVVVNKIQAITTSGSLPTVFDQSLANTYFDYTGSTFTWNLPVPGTVPNGFSIYIKNSGVGILTIAPPAGSTIDDSTSPLVLSPNNSTYLISSVTGSNAAWITFGKSNAIPSSVQFTTQGMQLTDGSQSLPSLAFISDLTTGIYSTGTGNISVTAGGTRVASFESSGSVPGMDIRTGDYLWKGVPLLYFSEFYP